MDQVLPNLWIGSLYAALDKALLDKNHIKYVVTAMRGDVRINPRLVRYQIPLDDIGSCDILTHFPPSIAFIQAAMEAGGGVLVHCFAGMSRSAAIVTAYLMHSQNIDADTALAILRAARPIVQPNEAFMAQLRLFHNASNRVSLDDKATRKYYLERTVQEVLSGRTISSDMFADHAPSSTHTGASRRKIRCRMCRHELATQEHMLEHGPKSTPKTKNTLQSNNSELPPSTTSELSNLPPLHGILPATPTPGSTSESTPIESKQLPLTDIPRSSVYRPLRAASESAAAMQRLGFIIKLKSAPEQALPTGALGNELKMNQLNAALTVKDSSTNQAVSTSETVSPRRGVSSRQTVHPSSKAPNAVPPIGGILAALKNPAPLQQPFTRGAAPLQQPNPDVASLLQNPKCSGYFVEPLKWMDFFLEGGEVVGKIICPNKRCGAKLGNYDWAGVGCSCKEWVTPGFCIHKSKVDEVW